MRLFGIVAVLLLAACTSATEQAEQEYAIVNKSGNATDVCRKGAEVAEAYLKAGDAEKYNLRRVQMSVDCQGRTMDENNGEFRMPDGSTTHIEADNMNAMPDTTD